MSTTNKAQADLQHAQHTQYTWPDVLTDLAQRHASHIAPEALNLYLLADPALDRAQYRALLAHSSQTFNLLPAVQEDAQHAKAVPQIMQLGSGPAVWQLQAAWHRAVKPNRMPGAFTILCSALPAEQLLAHLQHFLAVQLPQNLSMVLALWDPAILGTLVGQSSDTTLHVAGPVFTDEQIASLMQPITAWWYGDRSGAWHCIEPQLAASSDQPAAFQAHQQPLQLTQQQEDALVEASVPDQILYYIRLNTPLLFEEHVSAYNRYRFVRTTLKAGRILGLTGLRDLVNYTALCLIYRQRMQTDADILSLLSQVQQKHITLDEAMKLMPE